MIAGSTAAIEAAEDCPYIEKKGNLFETPSYICTCMVWGDNILCPLTVTNSSEAVAGPCPHKNLAIKAAKQCR
jgi:hypothetical protein